jgi:branched-chain amino acid transport system substrate-binding protein
VDFAVDLGDGMMECATLRKWALLTALVAMAGGQDVRANAADTLKIGVVLPLSGGAAGIGNQNLEGMRYAINEMGGKVNGKAIDLDIADDQNSPNEALTQTRRLIESDNVIAVIGTLNSAVALAIHPYTTREKTPYVTGVIAVDLTGARKSDFTFRASVAAGQVEPSLAHFLISQNLKRGILMGSDYAAGRDSVAAVGGNLKQLGGTVVEEIFPRQGETDYAPYFARNPTSSADFVYGYFFGGDTLRFVRQYASLGNKLPLVITAAALSAAGVAQSLGQDVNGIISPEIWWVNSLQDPSSKKLVETYTKMFGKAPETISIDGYIKAEVVLQALLALKGEVKDGTQLAAAMKRVRFPMPGGGEFYFDENNNPIVTVRLVRWEWKDNLAIPKVLSSYEKIAQDGKPVK